MTTPGACLPALRILLAGLACAAAAWLLGLVSPPAAGDGARAAVMYATTLLAFAAFPRMRRDDLAGATLGLALVAEACHVVVSRHLIPALPLADLAGVCAAWAPAGVEHFRRLARNARYVPFRDLADADRRRAAPTTRLHSGPQSGPRSGTAPAASLR